MRMKNNKGQSTKFVGTFILAVIGIVIAVELVPTIQNSSSQLTGNVAFASGLIPLLAVGGILIFGLKAFRIA